MCAKHKRLFFSLKIFVFLISAPWFWVYKNSADNFEQLELACKYYGARYGGVFPEC